MSYKYAVDDSDDRKLCRIVYGLVLGGYSIDRFIYDYEDFFNGKMENSAFRHMYNLLVNKVGSDAFSVLQRLGKSESDFNALCDRIRKLYAYYASTITTGHYERRGTHRQ